MNYVNTDTSRARVVDVIDLDLGPNSYCIYVGAGLLADAQLLNSCIAGRQVFIVTNETIAPYYLEGLMNTLGGHQVDAMTLPDGEQYKTLDSMNSIITELLRRRHNRGTTVVALGGGVVGDTAGFAAACYQRGVPYVQVPTTLLAQVDSSVGGKTAVNHELGKNMIGAFYQPRAVIIDIDTLRSLPERELSAGLAEVIKHALLADPAYFAWLEDNMDRLRALDADSLAYAVKRSCEIKASVVAEDEKETGRRALLNLGHTFGHAIENAMGYGAWLHGEAVGVGLIMACDLAMRTGMYSADECARVKALVARAGLPTCPPSEIGADRLFSLMGLDKKVSDQGMRFILPTQTGHAEIVENIDEAAIRSTLNAGESLGDNRA